MEGYVCHSRPLLHVAQREMGIDSCLIMGVEVSLEVCLRSRWLGMRGVSNHWLEQAIAAILQVQEYYNLPVASATAMCCQQAAGVLILLLLLHGACVQSCSPFLSTKAK